MDSYADHNEPGGEGRDGEVGVTLAEVLRGAGKLGAGRSAQVQTTVLSLETIAQAIKQYGRYNYVFDEQGDDENADCHTYHIEARREPLPCDFAVGG